MLLIHQAVFEFCSKLSWRWKVGSKAEKSFDVVATSFINKYWIDRLWLTMNTVVFPIICIWVKTICTKVLFSQKKKRITSFWSLFLIAENIRFRLFRECSLIKLNKNGHQWCRVENLARTRAQGRIQEGKIVPLKPTKVTLLTMILYKSENNI